MPRALNRGMLVRAPRVCPEFELGGPLLVPRALNNIFYYFLWFSYILIIFHHIFLLVSLIEWMNDLND